MNEANRPPSWYQTPWSRKRSWTNRHSPWQPTATSFFVPTQVVQCSSSDDNVPHGDQHQLLASIQEQKRQVQAELDRIDKEGPCPSCLYTGVATCLGLAGYFGYLAFDEGVSSSATAAEKTAKRLLATTPRPPPHQKPIYLAIAAGWVALGAYRWHLG